jgi:RNA polymerase-interacting CarD/CdnL/TRCF family regulator
MFKIGDNVAYGLHGKCEVTAITTKVLGDKEVNFYQIKQVKNAANAKSSSHDTTILVPVDSAQAFGLRSLMTKEEAQYALELLANEEWYFEINDTWVGKQKKFEECIRKEGYIGLAKVVGHLYIQIKKEVVPQQNVLKFYNQIAKIFTRELADALELKNIKEAEALIEKALRNKLIANN